MKKINLFKQIVIFLSLVSVNSGILYGDTINLPNGDIYEGKIKDGKMNGFGIIYHKNGSSTIAKWKENKMDDKYVKTIFPNGSSLEMSSINNGRYLKRKVTDANGDFCEKTIVDGTLKHERIRKTYENGGVYKGYAMEGIPNGLGEITYKSGISYKGKFEDGTLRFACVTDDFSAENKEELIDNDI